MTREELLERIAVRQSEDGFTERKRTVAEDDVIPTLVAFANSVSPDRTAVLFLGVDRTGEPVGVANADGAQIKINRWLDRCYPPLRVAMSALPVNGVEVLAIAVNASDDRPHFAGPAWVRQGSETVKASPQVYAELIASRNSVVGELLRHKGRVSNVVTLDCMLDGRAMLPAIGDNRRYECVIEGVTTHNVHVRELGGQGYDIPVAAVTLQLDHRSVPPRLTLRVRPY